MGWAAQAWHVGPHAAAQLGILTGPAQPRPYQAQAVLGQGAVARGTSEPDLVALSIGYGP